MSVTASSIATSVLKELAGLAPAAIDLVLELVLELVRGARASDDPEGYLKRRLEAEAVHVATQAAARAALEATNET